MENVLVEVMHTTHKLACGVSINEQVDTDEISRKMSTLGFFRETEFTKKL